MPEHSPGTRIAVLVPCWNEEQTIGHVVTAFRAVLGPATVYVYDNNSTDQTAAVAAAAGAVVRPVALHGKGHVVQRLFADVEADVYLLVDGDDTYDPKVAGEMVDLVVLAGNDLVTSSRIAVNPAAYRRGHVLGNRMLNSLLRVLFKRPVPDMLSGYKAMSRRFVKTLPVLSTGFEIEAEMAVHALELGVPIADVPAPYRERRAGSPSKLSTYRDGSRILRTIVRLLRQSRPLLFFGAIGVLLVALAVALGIPIVDTFAHTHKVPRFPTAILATGLVVLAALSITAGLVLDTVARARREAKLLRYLAIPGPLAARGPLAIASALADRDPLATPGSPAAKGPLAAGAPLADRGAPGPEGAPGEDSERRAGG